MMIPEKVSMTVTVVMTVAGFLQVPPVRGKLIFSQFSDKIVWNIYQACSYGIYLNMQN